MIRDDENELYGWMENNKLGKNDCEFKDVYMLGVYSNINQQLYFHFNNFAWTQRDAMNRIVMNYEFLINVSGFWYLWCDHFQL